MAAGLGTSGNGPDTSQSDGWPVAFGHYHSGCGQRRDPSRRRQEHQLMCGRYALSQQWDVLVERFILTNPKDIEKRFGFLDWHEKRIEPRFNIAPSQDILMVVRDPQQGLLDHMAKWGFAPCWAGSPGARKKPPPSNARAGSLAKR